MRYQNLILLYVAVYFLNGCVQYSQEAMRDLKLNEDPQKTLAYLQEIEKADPDNPKIYFQRARIQLQQSTYNDAQINIEKALELDPNNPDYLFLYGKLMKLQRKYDESIEALLQAESLGKKNADLYKLVAENYMKMGNNEDATISINRLVTLNNNAENQALKGEIMLAMNDTVSAINSYRKSIRLSPKFVEGYLALASIYEVKSNIEQSKYYISTALNNNPNSMDLLEMHARFLRKDNLPDSAKMIYKGVISQDRSRVQTLLDLSSVYLDLKKYDSAIIVATEAYELDNNSLLAKVNMARALDKQRKYNDAKAAYEEIIEIDSTFNLAVVELDNLQRKIAYLWRLEQQRKALDSARNNPPATIDRKEIDN